jgi:DNA-binding CsgD family transcriptional regulator
MLERPQAGYSLINEWDLGGFIASHEWDLVSPSELQVPEPAITSSGSATAEGLGTGTLLSPSRWNADSPLNTVPMRMASQPAESILGVLDSLKCGAFLFDLGPHVVSLNTIAHSCLGDGVVLHAQHLRATDPATDLRLQHMVCSVMQRTAEPNAPTSVVVQRRSRLPLVMRVVCLDQSRQQSSGSVNLLLLALDPELRREPPREVLVQAFGLTPVEADIAIGVASGKSLAEIATARGTKVGTVRVLSKRIFSKTHTHGQAELTGLLTRLALLVPRTEGEMAHRPAHGLRER